MASAYDAANRITGITNGMDGALSQTFGYDVVNRLTSESSGAQTASYQYDADGNRTYQLVNDQATSFAYPAGSNRLAGTSGAMNATYGYDTDGDITTVNGTTAYQYGPFDRLSYAGGESYGTSAEAQRIVKHGASGTTYFAPDASGVPFAEDQTSASAWLDYVWLNGRVVAVLTSTSGLYPTDTDQTGRPLVMTNWFNQAVAWQAQGLPFTRNVSASTWFNMNLGFPGQYYDSESGLWHNGYRDYDTELGRYIESDPIGLAGGVNTYAYVGNNPISNVDPLGLCYDKRKCAQASAAVAALGQQISSAGSTTSWAGIGLVAASGIAAFFAPEGAPAELDAGEYGVGLIEEGGVVSSIGAGVQGYARAGMSGAFEDGVGTAMVGFMNKAYAGWLFKAAGKVGFGGIAGLLDKATEAVKVEAAACTGQ